MSSDYNFHLDALNCLAATAGEIHETEKKTQGSKADEENIGDRSGGVKTTVEELETGGGDEKNEKSNMYTNLDSKVTGLEEQSYSSFLEEVRSSNPNIQDNIQELFDSVINSTSRASPAFARNPFSVYQLKPPNFSLSNFLNKQNDSPPFSTSNVATPPAFKTVYGHAESFLPPVFNESFMKQPWQSQPLSSYTHADYQKLLESLPPEYQTTHNLVKNHLLNTSNITTSGTNSLFSTLIEESQKILSSQEKKMQEKLHFQNSTMEEDIKTHLALLTKENEKILADSKKEMPEKPRKKSSQKRSRTSDSKKNTGPPFNPPKPPPEHNSPASAMCTFHEHTLLKMATRGFWSGDRGPFQDIFRLARVETMDLQYSVQEITEHCYKLIRERIMTTDAEEDILKHHMKSYIGEFDEYLERIFPVTLVAMNMYFPLASDYSQVTWHGVVPTGWSEYRRAVIIREVFEVLLYFMQNEKELPPYDKSLFENDLPTDLLFPVPFPVWKPDKSHLDKDSNNNLDSSPNVNGTPNGNKDIENDKSENKDVESETDKNKTKEETETSVISETAESTEISNESVNESKNKDDEKDETTKETKTEKHAENEVAVITKKSDVDEKTITEEPDKNVIIDKSKVKYSLQFKALWTRTSPKQPTVILDDESEISLGAYLERFPIEIHSPKGNVAINIAGKKYHARLILGYFRRGVQLVDYSKSNGNLVDTTSTLKNISMTSAIRKVPPGKISKLIHPELHLDNYTSSIFEIGAENPDGSLLLPEASSKSRARKRKIKSQSDSIAKTKKNAKSKLETSFKEEIKEPNTPLFSASPMANEVFSTSSRDSFHTKLEAKQENCFPLDLPLPKNEASSEDVSMPSSIPPQPPLFMSNLASPTPTPRMPSVIPGAPTFPANSYAPDILSSMQFISSRGNTELFSLHIMIDSYRRAAKYLLDTANHLELVARRTYQPSTAPPQVSASMSSTPQNVTPQPKKENKED